MLHELLTLLRISLGCGVVIALLLALRPVLLPRFSPQLYHVAWILVCLRLLLLGNDFTLPQAPVRLEVPQALADSAYDHYAAAPADNAFSGAVTDTDEGAYYFRHSARYETASGEQVTVQDGPFFRTVTAGDTVTRTPHWPGLLYAAHWTVAILLFSTALIRYGLFRRRAIRGSLPAGEGALELLRLTREQLGVTAQVELYRVPHLPAPLLMGFFHPVILVPQALPEEALPLTLAHELTHLKHGDPGYKLILTAAWAVHWFNPLVWLMRAQASRDAELYCDYDLLKSKDAEARRAYGQAILDQMTAAKGVPTGLTTGFSGSKKEVFVRFRAIMDASPKRTGGLLMALVAILALLAVGLVACHVPPSTPEENRAWITVLDPEAGVVSYIPLTQEQLADREGLWEAVFDGELSSQERTVPLAQGVELLHTYQGETYPLNPVTITHTMGMSQAGMAGEVELDGAGNALRIRLDSPAHLALDAAGLDFSGYCGTVYAQGLSAPMPGDSGLMSIDPCNETGEDGDHTRYALPMAEDAQLPGELEPFLNGLSSARYPRLWRFTLVDGAVTQVEGLWPEEQQNAAAALPRLASGIDGYNDRLDGPPDLPASTAVRDGRTCIQFSSTEAGVTLYVFDPPVRELYPAELVYGGRSLALALEIHPLAPYEYGLVAGSANLYLSDLTEDGVPELIYIYGSGGTGFWFDHCRVFDLAAMAERPVELDFSVFTDSIGAELVDRQDSQLIYQITGPDGQTQLASSICYSQEMDIQGGINASYDYNILLDREQGRLYMTTAFGGAGDPFLYCDLGALTAQLAYHPGSASFALAPPVQMELFQPMEGDAS